MDKIVACGLSRLPLFLSSIASELRCFGVYEEMDKVVESYVTATTLPQLWSRILLCLGVILDLEGNLEALTLSSIRGTPLAACRRTCSCSASNSFSCAL